MTETTMPTPSAISALAVKIKDDTDSAISIEHKGARLWRITAQSDRVTMWVEFNVLSIARGRLKWIGSQLYIDGVQVPLATGYDHLVRIFRDPDNSQETDPEEWVEVSPAEAPPIVQSSYAIFVASSEIVDTYSISIKNAARRWMVVVEDDRIILQCKFYTEGLDIKHPERVRHTRRERNFLSLIVEGEDVTEKIYGRLDKAMEMLVESQASPKPPPIQRKSSSKSDTTGVTVRKTAVMRV